MLEFEFTCPFSSATRFCPRVTNSLLGFFRSLRFDLSDFRQGSTAYDIAYDRYLQVANELEPRGSVNFMETRFRSRSFEFGQRSREKNVVENLVAFQAE